MKRKNSFVWCLYSNKTSGQNGAKGLFLRVLFDHLAGSGALEVVSWCPVCLISIRHAGQLSTG
ncbi:MAG: hypothetical protein CSB48_04720 [Proteobacteria bacterium]|nr:MAG: hypothetical protein CSB48_04720 [Pseudomonadota bacterium]